MSKNYFQIIKDGILVDGSGGGDAPAPVLIEKSVTENGTYSAADDEADGYSSVTVNVPSGGGGTARGDVNFYDYDGTIVNSYSAAEFSQLSAMPANPSHTGLTAQGWNWTLSNAKTYVASYGRLDIGQMYVTSDGKTRLYITLTEGRTSPILKLTLAYGSEVDVDWGDGTNHDTLSGSGDKTTNQHEYTSAGSYVISITVNSGSITIPQYVLSNGNSSTSSPDKAYLNAIKKVEIGSSVTSIGDNAFQSCYSLSSITIPSSVTSIGIYAFQSCSSLSSITIPSSVTSIGGNAFQSCYSLSSITILGKSEGDISGASWGANTGSPTNTQIIWENDQYTHIYGVSWDKSSATTLTRTDDAVGFSNPNPFYDGMSEEPSSPFDNLMPWSGMVKETVDGNVLVKIPKFWYKITNTDNELKFQIADAPVDGFHVSPAHADRGDGKGERDYAYIARYKCRSTDYKSVTGMSPKVNITRDAARTAIKAIGTGFYQQDFAMFWTIRMLYLVEYANWNSQAAIGYGCGNNRSVQNTGASDIMTYHTGTMQSARTTYGVGVQYRWIEDPWGNVREWCDGIYFSGSKVYCINNPANFSDTTGGTEVGTRPTTDGYISDWSIPTATGFEYALYPSAVSGGEQTYIADYCYYSSGGVTLNVGGLYNQNQRYGVFYLRGDSTASSSDGNLGARLMYLP
jgi:hypothetical protein